MGMSDTLEGSTAVQRKTPKGIMKSQRTSANSSQPPAGTPRISIDQGSGRYPFPDIISKHKFKSYKLKGAYEKPWLKDPAMKKTKWNNLIVGLFILAGFAGSGAIAFLTVWPYREGPVSVPLNS